eukprot:scaffold220_cov169-Amphora_coffeaeformis.AAC.10
MRLFSRSGAFILSWLCGIAVAQDAPNEALQIPLFSFPASGSFRSNRDGTFRNDFCHLSDQVIVYQNLTLDKALQGVDLHVALMQGEFVNWQIERNDPNDPTRITRRVLDPDFPGLVPRLLDELCKRAGCTWRNSYAAVDYADLPEDRSFNDMLYWSTEVYDLQAEWWMRSISRLREGMTFTEPWYDGTIIMVSKRVDGEKDAFDPWGWLAPFDRGVWIMVIATVLGSAIIHWLLQSVLNPNATEEEKVDPIEATWLFATAFAGQFEFDPQTGPARLFTFSIAFWALLMTSAYTANLASFLVIRNAPEQQIESIQQAVQLDKTMCVWKASGTEDAVVKAFSQYASSGKLKRTSQRGVYEGLKSGECDIAITEVSSWDVFQANEEINGDCSLAWIGRPFQNVPASFAVKSDAGTLCTSLLRDVFNLFLHDMESDGTIEVLWDEAISETATVQCDAVETGTRRLHTNNIQEKKSNAPENNERILRATAAKTGGDEIPEEDSDTTKLTLTNMGGVFMLHGVLSIISVACALTPWIWRRIFANESTRGGKVDPGPSTKALESDEGASVAGSERSLYYFDAISKPNQSGHEGSLLGLDQNVSNETIHALRLEMNDKLASIETKLATLLKQ